MLRADVPFVPMRKTWVGAEFKSVMESTCCGLTKSQWIWTLNFVCAIVHIVWLVLTIVASYDAEDTSKFAVTIYRTKTVWNSTAADGYDISLVENNMPIRIDLLTITFFALSAFFHSVVTIFGPFPISKELYWDCIDNCFMWWRWLEYSISSTTMIVGIALLTGIREQNALASVGMLMWATIIFGLLTELWSRPHINGQRWWNEVDGKLTNPQKMRSYASRMFPHSLGLITYVAMWVIILNSFYQQLDDLRVMDKNLYDRIPDFVPWAVLGSAVIFSSFTFPQLVYQWYPPQHYWKTELWYCILSLVSKSFLGGLLYAFVLRVGSFQEGVEAR